VAISAGGKPSRVGFKMKEGGKKVRVARKTGEELNG
jgi:ribosomal protein L24